MPVGTIYPFGYAAQNADQKLETLMNTPGVLLFDIRLRPTSRWRPQWRKKVLQDRWGDRYIHAQALGNVHYNIPDKPIRLLDQDKGIQEAATLLRAGSSLIIMCACKNYETCHRHTVVDLLREAIPGVAINQ